MIKILSDEQNDLYVSVAAAAEKTLGLKGDCAVELVFSSRDEIRELNAATRNIDSVTDVLSYPMLSEIKPFTRENYPLCFDPEIGAVMLGSIVICDAVAEEQAEEYGHSVERERSYLFLHGLLHLCGYDHVDESDRKLMRAKEEEILSCLGIGRAEEDK